MKRVNMAEKTATDIEPRQAKRVGALSRLLALLILTGAAAALPSAGARQSAGLEVSFGPAGVKSLRYHGVELLRDGEARVLAARWPGWGGQTRGGGAAGG